jgi:hypothetical protein
MVSFFGEYKMRHSHDILWREAASHNLQLSVTIVINNAKQENGGHAYLRSHLIIIKIMDHYDAAKIYTVHRQMSGCFRNCKGYGTKSK